MNIYIGIDPSINSTGLTIMNDSGFVRFFIIKENKLTKREKKAEEEQSCIFEYKHYDKKDVGNTENAYDRELSKYHNIASISDLIKKVCNHYIEMFSYEDDSIHVCICMEGISYGSIHSAAVMDLAGLNYLIRDRIHDLGKLMVTPPSEIKRFYTGSGNANKELMVSTFKGTYPDFELPKIDDVCDSYAMAKYAQHICETED